MNTIQYALALAKQYAVFPTRPGSKAPATTRGHLDASRDQKRVREMFEEAGEGAGIAVSCKASGIFVIDYDAYKPDEHAARWVEQIAPYLDQTLCHLTPRGGEHYIFKAPAGVKLPGGLFETIDIKHDGYVLWPPTEGYEVAEGPEAPIEAPAALLKEIDKARSLTKRLAGATGTGSNMFGSTDEALVSLCRDRHRHEAILRITMDLAKAHPDWSWETLAAAARALILEEVEGCDVDLDRFEVLLDWRDGSGELARAAKGAVKKTQTYDAGLAGSLAGKLPPPIMRSLVGTQTREEIEVEELPTDNEFYSSEILLQEPEELIPGLLHVGDLASVVGLTNVGKTSLTASWVAAMASAQTDRVGMQPIEAPLSVMWVSPEDRLMAMRSRIRAAEVSYGFEIAAPIRLVSKETVRKLGPMVEQLPGGEVSVGAVVKWIIQEVKRLGIDLVILDPYTNFLNADENSAQVGAAMTSAMIRIIEEGDTTLLYFAHTGKTPEGKPDDWYRGEVFAQRGSSAAPAAVDAGATLTPWFGEAMDRKIQKRLRIGARAGTAPNLIDFSVAKLRWGVSMPQTIYEIRGVQLEGFRRTVPCAFPIGEAEARLKIQEWVDVKTLSRVEVALRAKALIEVFGEGVHSGLQGIHDRMAAERKDLWPQQETIRPDKGFGADLVGMFRDGVSIGSKTVQMVYDPAAERNQDKVKLIIKEL